MYKIELLTTDNEIYDIKDIWERLYNENKELSPFQSYSWNKCLIKNKVFDGKLNFFVMYKHGEPLIIAPLIKKNRFFYSELSFIGTDTHSDYLNFIYSENLEVEDFEYFINQVLDANWRIIWNLTFINENSRISKYIEKLNIIKELYTGICVKIPIYKTSEEYINRLGKSTKKEIKSKQKYIERDYDNIRFEFYKGKHLEESLINKLMELYCVRREEKENKLDNKHLRFLLQYFSENSNVFLSCYYIDNKLAAFNLGLLTTTNDICLIIVAIDSKYKRYSVGNILIYNTINHLIVENEELQENSLKCTYYDLTRGNELYKYKCGGVEHNNYYYTVANTISLLTMNNIKKKINIVFKNPKLLFKSKKFNIT